MLTVEPIDRVVAGVLTILLLVVTVIGRRRRLVAGPRGLLVCGIGGPRIVPWSQVRSMDNVTSGRFGLSTTTFEIDLVDDDLLLFGRTDLGADPAEVLAVLSGWSAAVESPPLESAAQCAGRQPTPPVASYTQNHAPICPSRTISSPHNTTSTPIAVPHCHSRRVRCGG